MRGLILCPLLYLFFLSLTSMAARAQDSLLGAIINARDAIVTVETLQLNAYKTPRARAAIDPKTGRMVVARNVKAAQKKNSGAGVIIDPAGYIVTNFHTLYQADKFKVILSNQLSVPAKILKLMPEDDLVLLKIKPPFTLTAVTFADSDTIALGDDVINIGHSPFLKETISGGKIIGIAMQTEGSREIELIEVNIDLHKGDSGGPLFNRNGELIGMMAAKLKEKATFAIPANKIKALCEDFIK